MPNITVGGLPGTGTSTLCKLLQQATNLPYVYAGQLFRNEATRRGLSLAEFGALCQKDPTVDQDLDAQQVERLRDGDVLLEGRLAGWMAHRAELPAFKIWITCDDAERARRLAERDGGDVRSAAHAAKEREASERDRYMRYYNIDIADHRIYDLVLDSTNKGPKSLCDETLAAWQKHQGSPRGG